jgi:predicted metalloprotease
LKQLLIALCAHEFAHIAQYKSGLIDDLNVLRVKYKTVKRTELHADFVAGYYAFLMRERYPNFPAPMAALTHYDLGDVNTNLVTHHGTPKERGDAVEAGFICGTAGVRRVKQVLQNGLEYVSSLST